MKKEQRVGTAEEWFDENQANYKGIKSRHYAIQMLKDFTSQLQQPKRGEQHDTCDGCQMFQDCGCMLDDSCPECVDHHLWTPKEQPSDEDIEEWAEMRLNEIKMPDKIKTDRSAIKDIMIAVAKTMRDGKIPSKK